MASKSDGLKLVNAVHRWPDPPPLEQRYVLAVAKAADLCALYRDLAAAQADLLTGYRLGRPAVTHADRVAALRIKITTLEAAIGVEW